MKSPAEMLKDKFEGFLRMQDDFDFNLRCCVPGVVQSFDEENGTVTVMVAIKDKVMVNGIIESVQIPLLLDVPICIPNDGEYFLTFPIKVGSECLVVFSDICIDSWWQNGCLKPDGNYEAQEPMHIRRHDLSDGMAIFGVWSQPNKLTGYSKSSAQLRNKTGDNYFELSPDSLILNFGSNQIKVDSTGTTIKGKVTLKNQLEVDGETTIQNKKFLLHTHSGVQTGGGNTGGVV